MLRSLAATPSGAAPSAAAHHEFAYPRVSQVAVRSHTVLASMLHDRAAVRGGARAAGRGHATGQPR